MFMTFRRTLTVARKELLHILRDRRTLAVIILIPVVQLFLLGYAATTDVRHLRLAVVDNDHSAQSRELIAAYQATNYFDIVSYAGDAEELGALLDWGEARAGMIIPVGLGADLLAGRTASIAFLIDGSDPNVANTVLAISQQVGQTQNVRILERRLGISVESLTALEVRPRVWYNPEMKSVNFMVPALMGMILFLLTSMLTALAIVREREQGNLEQLLVTPIRPLELVVGKIIPYIGVAFLAMIEVLVIGVYWFRVPVNGSVSLLLALSGVFLFSSLGIGIFISTIAGTQQEAMLLVWLTLLPSIFLAGFFFPIEAMPVALQAISYLVPLRYMLVIIRGIILKGVGWNALAGQVAALAVFGIAILALAATRFRRQLG